MHLGRGQEGLRGPRQLATRDGAGGTGSDGGRDEPGGPGPALAPMRRVRSQARWPGHVGPPSRGRALGATSESPSSGPEISCFVSGVIVGPSTGVPPLRGAPPPSPAAAPSRGPEALAQVSPRPASRVSVPTSVPREGPVRHAQRLPAPSSQLAGSVRHDRGWSLSGAPAAVGGTGGPSCVTPRRAGHTAGFSAPSRPSRTVRPGLLCSLGGHRPRRSGYPVNAEGRPQCLPFRPPGTWDRWVPRVSAATGTFPSRSLLVTAEDTSP